MEKVNYIKNESIKRVDSDNLTVIKELELDGWKAELPKQKEKAEKAK